MSLSTITKLSISLVLATFMLSPAAAALTADPSGNLIANPGFESSTQAAGLPDDWATNSWGSNTASFQYLGYGHSGHHAAQTNISNYSSGDAKWMFTPVRVSSGTQYTYTDWYEASTATNVWAQYTNSDGSYMYQWLGSVTASSDWQQATENLTVPSNANAVSVFHVLNANGQLIIDDTSLTVACNVSNANGVYNGGFEQTCPNNPNEPADWQTETYGQPGASFAYVSHAHSGAHAVQTTMTNKTGEAGWQTIWQPITASQRYGLTFWQDGTAYVYAYAAFTLSNNNVQYISLMSVPATQNTGWSQYTDNFISPSNAVNIQITIATSEPGTFTLDDVYLNTLANQNPVNFTSGVVSLTFDDGDDSTFKNGLPVLDSNSFKATFYLNDSTLGNQGYMSTDDVSALARDNQEVSSHLYQHVDLVTLTQTQLIQQITNNNTSLQGILGPNYPITDFASPYGSYTSTALDTVMQYYQSHRTTDGQFNTKANLNPLQIHAILVTSKTSVSQVEKWISQAQQQDQWLVLVYHAIGSAPPGGDGRGYATTPANFTAEMSYLHGSGVSVQPINNALTDLLSQL